MLERLRILPVLMVSAGLLLVLKLAGLAMALDHAVTGVMPAQASEAAAVDAAHEAEKKGADGGDNVVAIPPQQAPAPVQELSRAEVEVLQSLADRRAELDRREKELDLRAQLLAATERKVEGRIEELKAIEGRIEEYLAAQDRANEEQMTSLVKMYESMKPKEAARIFERLDMDILLDVARRMNERKMAAVLASMDPVAAQELTVELAIGRRLPESLGEAPAEAAAPGKAG